MGCALGSSKAALWVCCGKLRLWRAGSAAKSLRHRLPSFETALAHRHEAELIHQSPVAVALGIGRGEELRPVEDRVGAGEEAQRLRLLAHVLAPGREPHHRLR